MAADVISQGYAKYKSGKSLSVWKKRWIVFRRLSSKGLTRIEQFEDEDAAQRHLIDTLAHTPEPHERLQPSNNNNNNNNGSTEDLNQRHRHNYYAQDSLPTIEAPQSPPTNGSLNPFPFPYAQQVNHYMSDTQDDTTVNHHHHHHHHHNQHSTTKISKKKTCPLTNVLTIERLANVKYALVIRFHDGSPKLKYAFSSNMEAECWLRLLLQECIPPTPPVIISDEPDLLVSSIRKELRERFRVYMMPTTKLEFFGDCLLQVTHENIYLWDIVSTNQKIAHWPLTALRRYGSDQNKFTFEAGRHCMTGEGRFDFHTFEGEKIYRKVHQATLNIAHVKTKTMRI